MRKTAAEKRQVLAQKYFDLMKLELREARIYWEAKGQRPHFDCNINSAVGSITCSIVHYSNALLTLKAINNEFQNLSARYSDRAELNAFCEEAQKFLGNWEGNNPQILAEHARREESYKALTAANDAAEEAKTKAERVNKEASRLAARAGRLETEEAQKAAEEAKEAAEEAQKAAEEAKKAAYKARETSLIEQSIAAEKAKREGNLPEDEELELRKALFEAIHVQF